MQCSAVRSGLVWTAVGCGGVVVVVVVDNVGLLKSALITGSMALPFTRLQQPLHPPGVLQEAQMHAGYWQCILEAR